jgi:hypothetical protein
MYRVKKIVKGEFHYLTWHLTWSTNISEAKVFQFYMVANLASELLGGVPIKFDPKNN